MPLGRSYRCKSPPRRSAVPYAAPALSSRNAAGIARRGHRHRPSFDARVPARPGSSQRRDRVSKVTGKLSVIASFRGADKIGRSGFHNHRPRISRHPRIQDSRDQFAAFCGPIGTVPDERANRAAIPSAKSPVFDLHQGARTGARAHCNRFVEHSARRTPRGDQWPNRTHKQNT